MVLCHIISHKLSTLFVDKSVYIKEGKLSYQGVRTAVHFWLFFDQTFLLLIITVNVQATNMKKTDDKTAYIDAFTPFENKTEDAVGLYCCNA